MIRGGRRERANLTVDSGGLGGGGLTMEGFFKGGVIVGNIDVDNWCKRNVPPTQGDPRRCLGGWKPRRVEVKH